MSVRPLPGASYHTFDAFPYTDLEALDHFDTPPGYDISPSDEKDGFDHTFHRECRCQQQHHSSSRRQSRYRGPPVLLSIIVLCCLAFVASAFWQYSSNALPHVPRRHASLADRLSSAFRTESQRAMINKHYDSALQMIHRKLECSSVGCDDGHPIDVRGSLLQTFTLENPSVKQVLVGESALVLHWQGTNSGLKPVLVGNNHAVLDVTMTGGIPPSDLSLLCGDEPEHFEELMDVQSGVGLLIAVDALLRSGYQPSRTLVLSLTLGDASDAPKVSQYLHDTYDESGLVMEFELHPPVCRDERFKLLMLRVFHTFADGVSRAFGAVFPASVSSSRRFETDAPRLFRFMLPPTADHATLTRLRVQMTNIWARMVLDGDY